MRGKVSWWKKSNNITNQGLFPPYFYFLLLKKMKKYGYNQKPVKNKGKRPFESFFVLRLEQKKAEINFPGRCLQSRSSTSEK